MICFDFEKGDSALPYNIVYTLDPATKLYIHEEIRFKSSRRIHPLYFGFVVRTKTQSDRRSLQLLQMIIVFEKYGQLEPILLNFFLS